jgi:hypothetical protein
MASQAGQESVVSQKSNGCSAMWSSASPGAKRGAQARRIVRSGLPTLWMCPSERTESSAPQSKSLSPSVFRNFVPFGDLEIAITAEFRWAM